MKRLLVAGTGSGAGKTSVCLGLLRALTRRGLDVQPFKAGPDFIDPGFHDLAVGVSGASENLDPWMTGEAAVLDCFGRVCARKPDIAIIEGVMGLFDGFSGGSDEGSSAHLARLVSAPVLLVLDGRSRARSVAAEALGFARFDPTLPFLGAVVNRTGGENHRALVAEAWDSRLDLPWLAGCLGREAGVELPSRHLGLVQAGERNVQEMQAVLDRLADKVERELDLDGLLARLPDLPPPEATPLATSDGAVRIGVARDAAFSFYYAENLRLLGAAGAELVFFSPLADAALPENLGGLYLGGGYPELHAERLAENASMRAAVRGFCMSGRPVLAECGGFMYLARAIVDQDGRAWDMAGVFDAVARMPAAGETARRVLGYRTVELAGDCPLGPAGLAARGHEFHASRLEASPVKGRPAFLARDRRGRAVDCSGRIEGRTVGSYLHLHFASCPGMAANFVRACAA